MKKSLEELIDVASDMQEQLQCGSFNLHRYYSQSYVEFLTSRVTDVPALLKAANGLELKLFSNDSAILVRLYERYNEDDT